MGAKFQDATNKLLVLMRQAWLKKHGVPLPAPTMTAQQHAEIEECFEMLDSDGSGAIDVEEIVSAFGSLGFPISKDAIEELMLEADPDGSGELEFDEFLSLMGRALYHPDEHGKALVAKTGEGDLSFPEMVRAFRRKKLIESLMRGGDARLKVVEFHEKVQGLIRAETEELRQRQAAHAIYERMEMAKAEREKLSKHNAPDSQRAQKMKMKLQDAIGRSLNIFESLYRRHQSEPDLAAGASGARADETESQGDDDDDSQAGDTSVGKPGGRARSRSTSRTSPGRRMGASVTFLTEAHMPATAPASPTRLGGLAGPSRVSGGAGGGLLQALGGMKGARRASGETSSSRRSSDEDRIPTGSINPTVPDTVTSPRAHRRVSAAVLKYFKYLEEQTKKQEQKYDEAARLNAVFISPPPDRSDYKQLLQPSRPGSRVAMTFSGYASTPASPSAVSIATATAPGFASGGSSAGVSGISFNRSLRTLPGGSATGSGGVRSSALQPSHSLRQQQYFQQPHHRSGMSHAGSSSGGNSSALVVSESGGLMSSCGAALAGANGGSASAGSMHATTAPGSAAASQPAAAAAAAAAPTFDPLRSADRTSARDRHRLAGPHSGGSASGAGASLRTLGVTAAWADFVAASTPNGQAASAAVPAAVPASPFASAQPPPANLSAIATQQPSGSTSAAFPTLSSASGPATPSRAWRQAPAFGPTGGAASGQAFGWGSGVPPGNSLRAAGGVAGGVSGGVSVSGSVNSDPLSPLLLAPAISLGVAGPTGSHGLSGAATAGSAVLGPTGSLDSEAWRCLPGLISSTNDPWVGGGSGGVGTVASSGSSGPPATAVFEAAAGAGASGGMFPRMPSANPGSPSQDARPGASSLLALQQLPQGHLLPNHMATDSQLIVMHPSSPVPSSRSTPNIGTAVAMVAAAAPARSGLDSPQGYIHQCSNSGMGDRPPPPSQPPASGLLGASASAATVALGPGPAARAWMTQTRACMEGYHGSCGGGGGGGGGISPAQRLTQAASLPGPSYGTSSPVPSPPLSQRVLRQVVGRSEFSHLQGSSFITSQSPLAWGVSQGPPSPVPLTTAGGGAGTAAAAAAAATAFPSGGVATLVQRSAVQRRMNSFSHGPFRSAHRGPHAMGMASGAAAAALIDGIVSVSPAPAVVTSFASAPLPVVAAAAAAAAAGGAFSPSPDSRKFRHPRMAPTMASAGASSAATATEGRTSATVSGCAIAASGSEDTASGGRRHTVGGMAPDSSAAVTAAARGRRGPPETGGAATSVFGQGPPESTTASPVIREFMPSPAGVAAWAAGAAGGMNEGQPDTGDAAMAVWSVLTGSGGPRDVDMVAIVADAELVQSEVRNGSGSGKVSVPPAVAAAAAEAAGRKPPSPPSLPREHPSGGRRSPQGAAPAGEASAGSPATSPRTPLPQLVPPIGPARTASNGSNSTSTAASATFSGGAWALVAAPSLPASRQHQQQPPQQSLAGGPPPQAAATVTAAPPQQVISPVPSLRARLAGPPSFGPRGAYMSLAAQRTGGSGGSGSGSPSGRMSRSSSLHRAAAPQAEAVTPPPPPLQDRVVVTFFGQQLLRASNGAVLLPSASSSAPHGHAPAPPPSQAQQRTVAYAPMPPPQAASFAGPSAPPTPSPMAATAASAAAWLSTASSAAAGAPTTTAANSTSASTPAAEAHNARRPDAAAAVASATEKPVDIDRLLGLAPDPSFTSSRPSPEPGPMVPARPPPPAMPFVTEEAAVSPSSRPGSQPRRTPVGVAAVASVGRQDQEAANALGPWEVTVAHR